LGGKEPGLEPLEAVVGDGESGLDHAAGVDPPTEQNVVLAAAAHFPMKVQVKENHILIENFLGEKHPRSSDLLPGTTAKVDGEFVILSGYDIEQVGQSAANIERASRIREYDPRVFQDGIYLVERAHLKGAA
ncbi:MAG: 50S ribosomal protein L6, partial [Thermoplasmata archaeon]